jgi:opacity protein-like surface antigen
MRYILIGLMLLASPVMAEDNAVVVHGGWEHTANSNYGDGWTGSVRYERRLWRTIWIGPEYTYHGPMLHHNGNDDAQFNYGDLSGHSLLGDLIWRPDVNILGTKPYLIGGAGWSWWSFDTAPETAELGITVDMGDAFAYKAGFGADYPLKGGWSLNVEWSFFKAQVPYSAVHPDGTPSVILGDDAASGEIRLGEENFKVVAGVRKEF